MFSSIGLFGKVISMMSRSRCGLATLCVCGSVATPRYFRRLGWRVNDYLDASSVLRDAGMPDFCNFIFPPEMRRTRGKAKLPRRLALGYADRSSYSARGNAHGSLSRQ
jgi:hypothetical protein